MTRNSNSDRLNENVLDAVSRFVAWLGRYGETSYDHQSFFAGPVGRTAKALYYRSPLLGTLAVAPMIACEAFLPSARKLFWKAQRFPIADAHYAMGFANLFQALGQEEYYQRAVHFLEVLQQTRSAGFEHYAWGYPFDWVTRNGTIKACTPLITTVPYCYEAFSQVYKIDGDARWREVMLSVARHALLDYHDVVTSPTAASCSYTPDRKDKCGVINASAYRSFLLTKAAQDFSDEQFRKVAEKNLNFVLESQNSNGSWFYSTDGVRDFVDHFHTCFVMKALVKTEQLTGSVACRKAIERGTAYYVKNLFDANGLPAPFSKAPRLTVYRRELYDCAECVNLAVLLSGRFAELDRILSGLIADLLARWQKPDGSFRARELLVGWDNVPMHRWAQSQIFRSLSLFLLHNATAPRENSSGAAVPPLAFQSVNS